MAGDERTFQQKYLRGFGRDGIEKILTEAYSTAQLTLHVW
jgi:hypothetical protein